MDLMLDPICSRQTWADALKLGWACDEEKFLWVEDLYRDGGVSAHGHRKLHCRGAQTLTKGDSGCVHVVPLAEVT